MRESEHLAVCRPMPRLQCPLLHIHSTRNAPRCLVATNYIATRHSSVFLDQLKTTMFVANKECAHPGPIAEYPNCHSLVNISFCHVACGDLNLVVLHASATLCMQGRYRVTVMECPPFSFTPHNFLVENPDEDQATRLANRRSCFSCFSFVVKDVTVKL